MRKVLVYNDKVFYNARSFYEFVLINVFDGNEPSSWNLEYIAVAFTKKLKTISGIKVDWVTLELEPWDNLRASDKGWMKWSSGGDKTFLEFVESRNRTYTKEQLWRWVIDYVVTYDLPRSRMKRLVDDVLIASEQVDKKRNVNVYKLKV